MRNYMTSLLIMIGMLIGFFGLARINMLEAVVAENDDVEIPAFPACVDLLEQPGDHASYEQGLHQIVGGDLLSGSDDVYSIENGNYVQCFCPDEGDEGIQTNWWQTDQLLDGWFSENGSQWNLGDLPFLAKNSDFSCDENGGGTDPTPTPEATPSATPTATPSATPAPTDTPEDKVAGAEITRDDDSDDDKDDDNDSDANDSEGEVSSISTTTPSIGGYSDLGDVKGLAATGGSSLSEALMMVGTIFSLSGLTLKKSALRFIS